MTTYSYDDNGNTLSKSNGAEQTTYVWNDENRLVGVQTADGKAFTYNYNTNGIRVSSTVDVLNRANLGLEVMHERNAHNFPLNLAAGEAAPVALTAPAING